MNINLDNYESFFLLYVDNELSATERKGVEEFLGTYPYLLTELEQLKETVLPKEEKEFGFKSGLLKPVMSAALLQEHMLLHLDDELVGKEMQQLEKMLMKDSHLQEEWALLRKTKLDAVEKVAFPDKSLLYRTEPVRLVIGRFARWAVAAALIGAGMFIGLQLQDKGNNQPTTATVSPPTKVAPSEIQPSLSNNDEATASTQIATTDPVIPAVSPKAEKPGLKQDRAMQSVAPGKKETSTARQTPEESVKPLVAEKDPGKLAPRTAAGRELLAGLNEPAAGEKRDGLSLASVKTKPTMHTDTNIQPAENLFARNVSLETDENSDDHIFMMDEDKVSRTKAAGFFKKIKRTVERSTKIKPGNSLRIAGFEFAVK